MRVKYVSHYITLRIMLLTYGATAWVI